MEIEIDNVDNLSAKAELTTPNKTENAQDNNLEPSENLRLVADNYTAWILVENEEMEIDIVRDDGKKKVNEDGNLIEIMVRDQLGVAKSERNLDLWDLNY